MIGGRHCRQVAEHITIEASLPEVDQALDRTMMGHRPADRSDLHPNIIANVVTARLASFAVTPVGRSPQPPHEPTEPPRSVSGHSLQNIPRMYEPPPPALQQNGRRRMARCLPRTFSVPSVDIGFAIINHGTRDQHQSDDVRRLDEASEFVR